MAPSRADRTHPPPLPPPPPLFFSPRPAPRSPAFPAHTALPSLPAPVVSSLLPSLPPVGSSPSPSSQGGAAIKKFLDFAAADLLIALTGGRMPAQMQCACCCGTTRSSGRSAGRSRGSVKYVGAATVPQARGKPASQGARGWGCYHPVVACAPTTFQSVHVGPELCP